MFPTMLPSSIFMVVYIPIFGLFKSLPELILIGFIVISVKRHFLNILGASLTEIACFSKVRI